SDPEGLRDGPAGRGGVVSVASGGLAFSVWGDLMKMRASPGLFLLLLLIGAIIVATCRLPARVPSGTWHIGQSTNAQAGSGPDLLEQPEGSRANIAAAYGKLPLSFEANRGQTDAHVQ